MAHVHIVVVGTILNNLPDIIPVMTTQKIDGTTGGLWFDRKNQTFITDNKELILQSLEQDIHNGIFDPKTFVLASEIITGIYHCGLKVIEDVSEL